MIRAALLALLTLSLVPVAAGVARADKCSGRSVEVVRAPGAQLEVEVRWNDTQQAWERRVISAGLRGDSDWSPVPGLGAHAHLVVLVGGQSPWFAILDRDAGHHHAGRLLVHTSLDGRAPATFRAYALEELLTADELARVRETKSHLQWLAPKPAPFGLEPDGRALWLETLSGRKVVIPLGGA